MTTKSVRALRRWDTVNDEFLAANQGIQKLEEGMLAVKDQDLQFSCTC